MPPNNFAKETAETTLPKELGRNLEATPLCDRLQNLQDRILAAPPTGLEADNGFYDDLSGEP